MLYFELHPFQDYHFSPFFQQVAGGAGDTDETGTNKDTHQLSVIWIGDARSTYLHNSIVQLLTKLLQCCVLPTNHSDFRTARETGLNSKTMDPIEFAISYIQLHPSVLPFTAAI